MNTYELRPSAELFDNILTNLSWSVAMVTAECAALCELARMQHDPAGEEMSKAKLESLGRGNS